MRFHRDPLLAARHQGAEVYAEDYARAVTGAKIGLGLLRGVCPDQHTTRTFEIPACGSMLLPTGLKSIENSLTREERRSFLIHRKS